MSLNLKIKRFFRAMMREDVRIILTFLVVILTVFNGYTMFMGLISPLGFQFNTPSIDTVYAAQLQDTDQDLLPDIIEEAAPGERVYHPNDPTKPIGWGTGTDPNDIDTDNDGFTDGVEDNWGSNPRLWINPGYMWIIWFLSIATVLFFKFRKTDMLREYEEFEQTQKSSGVAGKGGKFAYGSGSVFSTRKADDMSDDERKKAIESDARYQRMMGQIEEEEFKPQRNWPMLIAQFAALSALVIIIRVVVW
ncbi:MAG: hypothetical protein INQ03_02415 [Candidatus Heimdallarchaeota archaeon]|nr:hypothetical protein [Candidatus Heimdallarchaeota archaeon]